MDLLPSLNDALNVIIREQMIETSIHNWAKNVEDKRAHITHCECCHKKDDTLFPVQMQLEGVLFLCRYCLRNLNRQG